MPSLSDLIGRPPPGEITLLQGKVIGTPAGGTATIRFDHRSVGDPGYDAAENVGGVRMLNAAMANDGDSVWVLRMGGSLLILGKLGRSNKHDFSNWQVLDFSDRIEFALGGVAKHQFWNDGNYHVTGIGVGGDNTDNVGIQVHNGNVGVFGANRHHLINDGVGVGGWFMNGDGTWCRQTNDKNVYTGGVIGAGPAYMGNSAYGGSDFGEWSHALRMGSGVYSFLSQWDGATYVNAASAKYVYIRNNNTNVADFTVIGGVGFCNIYHRLIAHSDGQAWDNASVRSECSGNVDVAISWHQPSHRAYSFWFGTDRLGRVMRDDGVYPGVYMTHLVPSADAIKDDVKPLAGGGVAKLKRLRPVSYKQKVQRRRASAATSTEFPHEEPPTEIGLMAADIATAYPDAVTYDADGTPSGYRVSSLLAVLVQAVQELTISIETLERLPVIAMNKPQGVEPA